VPQETREMLDDIKTAAERGANLTRQLLAFSRRQRMQMHVLDLNEIVTSLTKMLQRILGEDVRLRLDLHQQSLMTHADAGMLDQVLLNLVVNARDAMPDGGRLTIETSKRLLTETDCLAIPDTTPGRYVSLRVVDTGKGITPEVVPHIFEPFFTTKEPGKGTGLGLATVFGIVKQHGGAIQVESTVQLGTAFTVLLRADERASDPSATDDTNNAPKGGSETILLVEDEPSLRILTRIILERAGYRVLEAANGPEANQAWGTVDGAVDLLLTDIVMPEGVSGHELAAQLRVQRPRLKVIFTSGYSADVAGRELNLQTGQNFIQKPCSTTRLLGAVRLSLDS
jgi:CheY-like chemotaxis protein